MAELTVDALILKSQNYAENDKLLTVLAGDRGIMSVMAKGVRKMTSKNAASVQPFCYSTLELASKGDLYTLKTAVCTHSFPNLAREPEVYALACYFAESAMCFLVGGTGEPEVLRLLLNALYLLENDTDKPQWLIKSAYELKLTALAGFLPDFDACENCGRALDGEQSGAAAFDMANDICLCADCAKTAEQHGNLFFLSEGVRKALRYAAVCPVNRFAAFRVPESDGASLSLFAEKYLLHVAGRKPFDTLQYYKSLLRMT